MEDEAPGGSAAAAAAAAAPAEPDVIEKDDDERELEKLEKADPEMLRICHVIIEHIDRFKVRGRVPSGRTRVCLTCVDVFLLLRCH